MKLKTNILSFLTFVVSLLLFLTASSFVYSQEITSPQQKNSFWEKVRFGGGLGLSVGSGYSNIMVAPSAIYHVNNYFSTGLGIQYSYVSQKNWFDSHIYGISLIELVNPIPELQLSAELEQLRVNNTYTEISPEIKDNFWNTALFLGAGYRNQNVTIGIRYNILYRERNNVYSEAWMPFVRIYF
ncbi:hypothetical protein [Flavobacterium sp. SM15]|uniref:hypothetical protein n=1 Tax=Flavobacterium sp. SM15 TaxID=2908005 RepID=UPI00351CBADE